MSRINAGALGLTVLSFVVAASLATADDTRMGSLEARRVFTNPAEVRTRAQGALQTSFILRMALRESISIFGLVLGFLGHSLPTMLPFFVASWALMALAYPSERGDDAQIEQATGIALG